VRIGCHEIRKVLFTVLPDDTAFFGDGQLGRIVLGLPFIQALDAVQWDQAGTLVLGAVGSDESVTAPNLAFAGDNLMVDVGFQGQRLRFCLDTGADYTNLYVAFRDEFADQLKDGKVETRRYAGVSGAADFETLICPRLAFRIGGVDAILAPAEIKLGRQVGSGYHGNLGLDLLRQGEGVAIDFRRMRIVLEKPKL
jgi:hypothetical protein